MTKFEALSQSMENGCQMIAEAMNKRTAVQQQEQELGAVMQNIKTSMEAKLDSLASAVTALVKAIHSKF
jgi:hypothetical protein